MSSTAITFPSMSVETRWALNWGRTERNCAIFWLSWKASMTFGSGASVRPSPYVARNDVVPVEVRANSLQALTDSRVEPGVDERDPPLFEIPREELDLRAVRAAVEHEVVEHRSVVGEEVALDDVALVAEAEDELVVAPRRVVAHDVPEDRPAADLDHRLRDAAGLLAHAHSVTATEDHNLHVSTPRLSPLPRVAFAYRK